MLSHLRFARPLILRLFSSQPPPPPINWAQKDKDDLYQMDLDKHYTVPKYKKMVDKWKKPLARKKAYKERKQLRDAQREPTPPMPEQFVVHSIEQGIELPADPEAIFAIVRIGGSQHKVTRECKIICDSLKYEVGQQLSFPSVMLVGTRSYTSIGRPFVETARVLATVEEHSLAQKAIIFKKKRRQGYQRNQGYRSKLTVLRVDAIEHDPGAEVLQNFKELS